MFSGGPYYKVTLSIPSFISNGTGAWNYIYATQKNMYSFIVIYPIFMLKLCT